MVLNPPSCCSYFPQVKFNLINSTTEIIGNKSYEVDKFHKTTYPCKHENVPQCLSNASPPSMTITQNKVNIETMYLV